MVRGKTHTVRKRSKPSVSIVLPEKNPVLCPGGKHSVWLINSFGNQIIDEHTYVTFVSSQNQFRFSGQLERSVNSSHKSLSSSLFVTGSTINLTSKIKTLKILQFQSRAQLNRVEIVVFHSIGRTINPGVLHSFDLVECSKLDVHRERRRKALEIVLSPDRSLRLKEKLMFSLVRKDSKLVFNAWTVARSPA